MKNIIVSSFIIFCSLLYAGCMSNSNKVQETFDGSNFTYFIENENVTLKNGIEEKEIKPDSASKQVTEYLGYEAAYDFNKDGIDDYVLYLKQHSGGSGVFYYLAVVLSGSNGYLTGNAMFIGDRIEPVEILINEDVIEAVYMDRTKTDPMVRKPSVKRIKEFIVLNDVLIARYQ